MPIDVNAALSAEPTVREAVWTERDVILYHLGLGAGADSLDPAELRWVYEKNLQVTPTFAMVAGQGISAGAATPAAMNLPGIDIDLRKILHGGQSLTLHAPIPGSGTATISSRVSDVWDKGKAAVIVLEQSAHGADGSPLWTSAMQIWHVVKAASAASRARSRRVRRPSARPTTSSCRRPRPRRHWYIDSVPT